MRDDREYRESDVIENLGEVDLGPCCACGRSGPEVRTVMLLHFRLPTPSEDGWGCFVCGLPSDGAVAVLCDGCVDAKREPTEYCAGTGVAGERAPVPAEADRVPFDHDEVKHDADEARRYLLIPPGLPS